MDVQCSSRAYVSGAITPILDTSFVIGKKEKNRKENKKGKRKKTKK